MQKYKKFGTFNEWPAISMHEAVPTSTNTSVDLFQKEPSIDVLIKMGSGNTQQINRKTHTLKRNFNKVSKQ